MTADPIVMMNARELSRAIHAREVSCVQVMNAYLDQIETHNPRVNAIISMPSRSSLLAEAALRDTVLASGVATGWMHGFPAAVKDLDSVRGLPWTQGSPLYATFVGVKDSIQVERMRASGVVFVGKTNTPEFGLGSHTYNPIFGATLNPYDERLTAGGSSGGAGAALALRMLPVADGSDHAGSLRNPAAFNNLYSLRPSFGRIPDESTDVFSTSLGVVGPMARTADDLAMLLSVQAGPDTRAPLSINEDPAVFAALAGAPLPDLTGKRIAWLGDLGGLLPLEAGVADVCLQGLKVFEQLGCEVEPLALEFPVEQVWMNWLVLRAALMSQKLGAAYDDPKMRALLKPEAVWEVENGLRLTPKQIADATMFRTRWFNEVRRLHRHYDALVLPSAQVFPFPVEQHWPTQIAGRTMDTYHRWMQVVIPGTMSGCPIAGIPAGFNDAGLPMGMQMIFPMHREADALAYARAYDSLAPWPMQRLPPALLAQA
jgi:amidase